jgi:hypothetical protein
VSRLAPREEIKKKNGKTKTKNISPKKQYQPRKNHLITLFFETLIFLYKLFFLL